MQIDLNADLGEGFGPWSMGDDTAMLDIVTSANVACGGHASDPDTMYRTLCQARDKGVTVGAHPGFNDPLGFGRRVIPMAPDEIGRMVVAQIGALQGIAALAGVKVAYVKPHGALGNLAARERGVADAIVAAIRALDPQLALLAISGTQSEEAARAADHPVFSEVFADRGYLPNGQLVPRGQIGAMIHDAGQASARLLSFLETGQMPVVGGEPIALKAQSICVHGDGPTAVAMARDIRARLTAHGVTLAAFLEG
ncbi:LamB/YcsF family protein [Pseudooctadecabacter jejudonensis]|uniref:5-oxoprolinase subunit A n=1 Tax=Pseudooctadecabacter jejudonensis TaxID=1391910 RepID=A0A1Y5RWR6_9RHOB|nr:5-oxoprolinase subunit PxpA [Pseudooctadecabacter jejudonensis]SLN27053.1 LamB/YcsF family protein [Pseudooctadecabacter jejudonensis]